MIPPTVHNLGGCFVNHKTMRNLQRPENKQHKFSTLPCKLPSLPPAFQMHFSIPECAVHQQEEQTSSSFVLGCLDLLQLSPPSPFKHKDGAFLRRQVAKSKGIKIRRRENTFPRSKF